MRAVYLAEPKGVLPQPTGGEVMREKSAIEEKQIQEIREHINAMQTLVDLLPESRGEALAHLDEMVKKIRVMQEGESPPEPETEMCIGT
jgi:hypothetical protein